MASPATDRLTPGLIAVSRPVLDRSLTRARTAGAPRPHLYLFIFGAWALSIAWFHPRLWSIVQMGHTPLEWAALSFFVLFTELAWLYGFYNVGVILFASIDRRQPRLLEAIALPSHPPPVALLYTTCNDFVEASALSCLKQDYPSFTLYLLDDSTRAEYQERVDRFAARHPGRVQVVRRADRSGFKAGNVNHALGHAAVEEPLFALVDSDELLPRDFLRRTVPVLLADERRGFVQANHRANPKSESPLARDMAVGVDIHWKWYQPLRNRYGFVMLLGHGAVIRRRCWEEVGGFPEIVSEDLAFAIRARDCGWKGHFAEDVVCYEEFPESVRAFRVRHMKWTRGTCELLSKEMPRLLLSRNIPLVEKLDVLFPTLNLGLSLAYFLFVLDANLLLGMLFAQSQPATFTVAGHEVVLSVWKLGGGFSVLQGFDFFAITLLTLLSPVLCFIIDLAHRPWKLFRFLGRSTALYGALAPLSSLGSLFYLLTRRAVFHVTGDRQAATTAVGATRTARFRAGWRRLLDASHPDHRAIQAFEIACGAALAVMCVKLWQVSFLGVALSNAMLPVLHHVRWSHPLTRLATLVPVTLLLAGMALGGLAVAGLPTALFGYGFHF